MNTLIFLSLVALLVVGVLYVASLNDALVEEARVWWRLRSMQFATAVAVAPQAIDALLSYFSSLFPEVQAIFLSVLPQEAQNALSLAGAGFALYRLLKQRGLPRIVHDDPADRASA